MTRNDITDLANQAGLRIASVSDPIDPRNVYWHEVERFAALVAAAEREACAKLCEGINDGTPYNQAIECADAIRARGQA